jgi:YesN/AraC family two-component response regulator
MIRILLVDDRHIIRRGIKSILECYSDMQVIGEAENGQEAIDQIPSYSPTFC